MAAPFFSNLSLFTELILTSIVLFTFYSGYFKNRFPYNLVIFAIGYETIFNISYMAIRSYASHVENTEKGLPLILGISHGILSLFMFVALIAYMFFAWRNYKKKINYFKKHKAITIIFLALWILSIGTGILLYIIKYL